MTLGWPHTLIALVAIVRLAEVIYSERNARRLLFWRWQEVGAGHYPLFVILHSVWLISLFVFVPPDAPISWFWLAIYLVFQAGRAWVLLSLGRYWTTRIITKPGAPLVTDGPYRFIKHPNYVVVAGEVATLPLIFGAWEIAVLFSILNGVLLWHRIRVENEALALRLPVQRGNE